MNYVAATIAAVSTTAILSGSAQANGVDAMIDTLKLPVDKTAVYYNEATQNVVTERCKMGAGGQSVVCDLTVYGNESIMEYVYLGMTYAFSADGGVAITPGTLSQGGWDTESDGGKYRTLKAQATVSEWSASSPLATVAADGTVIQNNVRVTKMVGDGAYRAEAFSAIPISESRGINMRQSFEDISPALASIEMTVVSNGAVLSAQGDTASRGYVEGDYDVVEKYYKASLNPYYKFE